LNFSHLKFKIIKPPKAKKRPTKVVDLKKFYNFVVDNLFISIHLGSQILLSKSNEDKLRRTSVPNGHKCLKDGVA
jgi:imidazoleglycerol phosphate synthase glutamine amidotransferase subunit HisH